MLNATKREISSRYSSQPAVPANAGPRRQGAEGRARSIDRPWQIDREHYRQPPHARRDGREDVEHVNFFSVSWTRPAAPEALLGRIMRLRETDLAFVLGFWRGAERTQLAYRHEMDEQIERMRVELWRSSISSTESGSARSTRRSSSSRKSGDARSTRDKSGCAPIPPPECLPMHAAFSAAIKAIRDPAALPNLKGRRHRPRPFYERAGAVSCIKWQSNGA